jgi:hypothetical protein
MLRVRGRGGVRVTVSVDSAGRVNALTTTPIVSARA